MSECLSTFKADSSAAAAVPSTLAYVLITPARNEEAFIGKTIQSVVAQTQLPLKWVIVSDGSTDRTDAIVAEYASRYRWVELMRMPEHRDRQFAAKATCFNSAFETLRGMKFDLIGNLDADITVGPEYYAFLVGKFETIPRLGVGGTPFVEDLSRTDHHSYAHRAANTSHVSGACQMFRRECFEEIGRYTPIEGGGIDWMAVTTARMRGVGNTNVHRGGLLSSPKDGHRWSGTSGCEVPTRTRRLLCWRASHILQRMRS